MASKMGVRAGETMELIRVEHSAKKYKEWVRIEWNMGKRCNFDCSCH
jgi:hypothetical protein